MNCYEARRYWHLYHDSEGDAALHVDINEHLAACPDCAKWFFQQSQLEDLLSEKLRIGQPDAALWQRVQEQCRPGRQRALRSWLFGASLLALAAAVAIVVGVWRAGESPSGDLAALTAQKHASFVDGGARIEFASNSDIQVEDYLRERVDFPVRCPPRKDSGFAVQGAGVCRILNDDAAYVIGDVDGAEVSVFILASRSLVKFPHQQQALSRERQHRCRQGQYEMVLSQIDRNLVLVIGQTDAGRLRRVLDAYGSYPHAPAG